LFRQCQIGLFLPVVFFPRGPDDGVILSLVLCGAVRITRDYRGDRF
jgi:hypothetical protein